MPRIAAKENEPSPTCITGEGMALLFYTKPQQRENKAKKGEGGHIKLVGFIFERGKIVGRRQNSGAAVPKVRGQTTFSSI